MGLRFRMRLNHDDDQRRLSSPWWFALGLFIVLYGLFVLATGTALVGGRSRPTYYIYDIPAYWLGAGYLLFGLCFIMYYLLDSSPGRVSRRQRVAASVIGLMGVFGFISAEGIACVTQSQKARERREQRRQEWLNSPEMQRLKELEQQWQQEIDEMGRRRGDPDFVPRSLLPTTVLPSRPL